MKVVNTALAVFLLVLGYCPNVQSSDLRYQIDLLAQQAASLINTLPASQAKKSGSEEANSLNAAYSKINEIKELSKNTHYQQYGQRTINKLTATLGAKNIKKHI